MAAHSKREPIDRWAKLARKTNPQGRRPSGRPRTRWIDNIKQELNIMGIDLTEDLILDAKR